MLLYRLIIEKECHSAKELFANWIEFLSFPREPSQSSGEYTVAPHPLIRTPFCQKNLSLLERCPLVRGSNKASPVVTVLTPKNVSLREG